MEIKIVFLNIRNDFNSMDYELIDGRKDLLKNIWISKQKKNNLLKVLIYIKEI